MNIELKESMEQANVLLGCLIIIGNLVARPVYIVPSFNLIMIGTYN